ncbi:MAG: hypothetical protein R3E48_01940 [Burkholderiaceae bacterium]
MSSALQVRGGAGRRKSSGALTIDARDIVLKASGNATLQAGKDLSVQAGPEAVATAGARLRLRGSDVVLNDGRRPAAYAGSLVTAGPVPGKVVQGSVTVLVP